MERNEYLPAVVDSSSAGKDKENVRNIEDIKNEVIRKLAEKKRITNIYQKQLIPQLLEKRKDEYGRNIKKMNKMDCKKNI